MSLDEYTCEKCGASFGIAGTSTGSVDDLAADEYFSSEIEYHQSGDCATAEITTNAHDERAEYIAGLRALADALEADRDLVLPYTGNSEYSRFSVFTDTRRSLQLWAKAIPGTKDKEVTEDQHYGFEVLGQIRGLHVRVYGKRDEVCTRRVVGTETVTEKVATEFVDREVTRDVVEWDCGPLLGDVR